MNRRSPFGRIRAATGLLLLAAVALASAPSEFAPVAGTFGPRTDILVVRPTILLEVWASDGRALVRSEMRIDDEPVEATYDADTRTLSYRPSAPLSPGEHKVSCRIGFEGAPAFRTGWKFRVLPDAADRYETSAAQDAGVAEVSRIRAKMALPPAVTEPALVSAAVRHADYCAKNGESRHLQQPGSPGFFGVSPQDRMAKFGWVGGSYECLADGQLDPRKAVVSIFASPYHRIPFMQPGRVAVGMAINDGFTAINFSMPRTLGLTVSPAPGETGVPSVWKEVETPDPLRIHDGVSRPTGFPIVFSLWGMKRKLSAVTASLTCAGKPVPFLLNSPANDDEIEAAAILIPKKKLDPNTTYSVTVKGVDEWGAVVEKSWSFTTG